MAASVVSNTVLRVKRRLEDNPQDALVIMCKRLKTDKEEISPALFVFRGTLENETTNLKSLATKSEIKLKSTPDVKDIIEKLRKERKELSSESRYEVINFSRGLKHIDNDEDLYDLVDLQQTGHKETDVRYAYDLYTPTKKDFDISTVDDIVRIENIESELLTSYRDGRDTPSDLADDDDDSNDENNWRNDYPDSEPSSINEQDMITAMENVDIGQDLSSDDGEANVYHQTPFNDDVTRYGEAYARYKARVMHEETLDNKGLILTSKVKDLDEESVDGYKDESDDGFYYGQEEDTEHFKEQYASDVSDTYSPD